jgi:hypothetical protein
MPTGWMKIEITLTTLQRDDERGGQDTPRCGLLDQMCGLFDQKRRRSLYGQLRLGLGRLMAKPFHEEQPGPGQSAHDGTQGDGKRVRGFLVAEAFDASEHENKP